MNNFFADTITHFLRKNFFYCSLESLTFDLVDNLLPKHFDNDIISQGHSLERPKVYVRPLL